MKQRDAFLPKSPYDHLYVVISDPVVDGERVVLVSFTSNHPGEEQLCLCDKGDHQFFVRESAVRYKDARIVSVKQLEELVAKSALKKMAPVSEDILASILDGAKLSDFLPEGCRRILSKQDLI